jgi:hypothetical protein
VTNFLVSSPKTINTNNLGNCVQLCMSGHREIRISSVECVVNLCESHVTGYNIKDNLKQGFVNLFGGKPTVIPVRSTTTCIFEVTTIQVESTRR